MRLLLVVPRPQGAELEADSPAQVVSDLGCQVTTIATQEPFDGQALAASAPQVIVLDAREDVVAAYTQLRELRRLPSLHNTPALIAVGTARLPALDYRAADDFVLVPVVPAELYARLRQLDWRFSAFAAAEQMKLGDLLLDLAGHQAYVRDRRLDLTKQEFALLKFLAQHPGRVYTREQLLQRVWGYRFVGTTRTVDIHVRRVRAKLGAGADAMLETVRGVGYRVVTVEDSSGG